MGRFNRNAKGEAAAARARLEIATAQLEAGKRELIDLIAAPALALPAR